MPGPPSFGRTCCISPCASVREWPPSGICRRGDRGQRARSVRAGMFPDRSLGALGGSLRRDPAPETPPDKQVRLGNEQRRAFPHDSWCQQQSHHPSGPTQQEPSPATPGAGLAQGEKVTGSQSHHRMRPRQAKPLARHGPRHRSKGATDALPGAGCGWFQARGSSGELAVARADEWGTPTRPSFRCPLAPCAHRNLPLGAHQTRGQHGRRTTGSR